MAVDWFSPSERIRMRANIGGFCLTLVLLWPGAVVAQDADAASEIFSREEWLAGYRHFGVAASLSYPYADFRDQYDAGFGLHALVDYPVSTLIRIAGDVAWNRFPGDDDGPALDVFSAFIEGRIVLAFFYAAGGTGYLTGVDHVGYVPSFGLRFDRTEFSVRWVAVGSDSWTTLRAGFYF